MKQFRNVINFALMLLLVSAGSAWALAGGTAANTRITNSADLSYNDGTGTKHATSAVTVTVALKSAIPTITAVVSVSGPYPTPLVDDFILTNNANGPDTFVLTTGTNTLVNLNSVTATPGTPAPATPITLGATVTAAGSNTTAGITYLIVPSDGVSDGSVNGIKVGTKVVVNGEEKTVSAITDSATGTSVIQIPALTAAAPGPGVVVGERVTVHATVTPVITASGITATANVTMTATSSDATFLGTSGNDGNTWYSGSATLTKYVRNASTNLGTGGSTTTLNGFTYYNNPTTLVAKPGETLEYLLLVTNGSASVPVTSIVLTDLLPMDYVTLTLNAYGGKAFRYIADTSSPGTTLDFTSADLDDAVSYNPTFIAGSPNGAKAQITAWIGGAAPAYNTPGTLAISKSMILLYQVTVNP